MGKRKAFWASSLFVCVKGTYMILFTLKGIYGNVNSIYCHMVIKTQKEVISMTWLTKANRTLLEQNLSELNRELALARKEHDEESIVILEAQVNATIRELDN